MAVMKVLFVCRGNVGRSQMAASFYNQFSQTHSADSAGTYVERPGQTLLERRRERPGRSFVVDAMLEVGLDIEGSVSTQITNDMPGKYDKVVSMAGRQYTPKWLSDAPNYVYWKVRDPMGRSYATTVHARDIIRQKVIDLVQSEAA